MSNDTNTNQLVSGNMTIIKEYLNILKVNPRDLINSSYDKSSTLNSYIDQLEYRYKY
jgi:hypothetical protein